MGEMIQRGLLGIVEILQESARGDEAAGKGFHPQADQGRNPEMPHQALSAQILIEIVRFQGIDRDTEAGF